MTKEHSNTMLFSVVSLLGSFIIIGISILKQYVTTKNIGFIAIIKTGDIYIICASMAITAIYNFHYFKDEISTRWPTIFFYVAILNYTLSLLFYLMLSITTQDINGFLVVTVIIVFTINMLITYLSTYYQNLNTDVVGSRLEQRDHLQDSFLKSQGGN